MKLNILLLSIAVSTAYGLRAQQTDDTPAKRIRVTEVDLYPSFILQQDYYGTVGDFKKLAPQSKILNQDLGGYSQQNYKSINGEVAFTGSIGITFLDKKRNAYRGNPVLRIGISYLSSTNVTSQLSKSTRTRFDTLSSANGGTSAYVDSVKTDHIGMRQGSDEVRLDLSLIFRTKPAARWGLFGGIGITAGGSIRAYTNIDAHSYSQLETTYNGDVMASSHDHSNNDLTSEYFINNNIFVCSAYLPIGIDYRLASKNEFWKRLHLFYEVKPSLNLATIKQLGTLASASVQNGIGLRISF